MTYRQEKPNLSFSLNIYIYYLWCWTDSLFFNNQDIQELLSSWKHYFAAASSIFIHAPSNNRQLLFDGEKPYFICQHRAIRNIPLTIRRPTLKEARRIYGLLVQISSEISGEIGLNTNEEPVSGADLRNDDYLEPIKMELREKLEDTKTTEACSVTSEMDGLSLSVESKEEEDTIGTSTPLHEASKSGNAQEVLELLEQGLDPCAKDERGQTPYMLANEKEVRNTFRRFMASNLEKWDWHAAKVPSPLTKEMEESQAAKQVKTWFTNSLQFVSTSYCTMFDLILPCTDSEPLC